ncbi:MAG TPA: hypothetical protein VI756_21500 [Blastocatellia bacterium]
MENRLPERVGKLIDAYFKQPREKYAELVTEIREKGGLTSNEVRVLKDKLLYVHSDTIVRQAGLQEFPKA